MNAVPRREPMPVAEAEAFLGAVFGGEHNIPGKLKPFGYGWRLSHRGDLATFDSDRLTALVLLAHDRCIRVSIVPSGPGMVGIAVHKRDPQSKELFARHPTIEEALVRWRTKNPARGAVSVHAPVVVEARTAAAVELPGRPWRDVLDLGGDTVTSNAVDRQFKRLSEGVPDESLRYFELVEARRAAKHELCFETDQSQWGG